MRRARLALWLCLALCAAAPARAAGEVQSVVVIRVTDGDTLWVRADPRSRPYKLRLQGIDAPERCQAWGAQSKAALASRVLNQTVQIRLRAYDDYQRGIATLERDGEDIAAWMVREGHAWSYRWGRSLGPYATEEKAARAARRGLFAAEAVEPRAFRKQHGPCDP